MNEDLVVGGKAGVSCMDEPNRQQTVVCLWSPDIPGEFVCISMYFWGHPVQFAPVWAVFVSFSAADLWLSRAASVTVNSISFKPNAAKKQRYLSLDLCSYIIHSDISYSSQRTSSFLFSVKSIFYATFKSRSGFTWYRPLAETPPVKIKSLSRPLKGDYVFFSRIQRDAGDHGESSTC